MSAKRSHFRQKFVVLFLSLSLFIHSNRGIAGIGDLDPQFQPFYVQFLLFVASIQLQGSQLADLLNYFKAQTSHSSQTSASPTGSGAMTLQRSTSQRTLNNRRTTNNPSTSPRPNSNRNGLAMSTPNLQHAAVQPLIIQNIAIQPELAPEVLEAAFVINQMFEQNMVEMQWNYMNSGDIMISLRSASREEIEVNLEEYQQLRTLLPILQTLLPNIQQAPGPVTVVNVDLPSTLIRALIGVLRHKMHYGTSANNTNAINTNANTTNELPQTNSFTVGSFNSFSDPLDTGFPAVISDHLSTFSDLISVNGILQVTEMLIDLWRLHSTNNIFLREDVEEEDYIEPALSLAEDLLRLLILNDRRIPITDRLEMRHVILREFGFRHGRPMNFHSHAQIQIDSITVLTRELIRLRYAWSTKLTKVESSGHSLGVHATQDMLQRALTFFEDHLELLMKLETERLALQQSLASLIRKARDLEIADCMQDMSCLISKYESVAKEKELEEKELKEKKLKEEKERKEKAQTEEKSGDASSTLSESSQTDDHRPRKTLERKPGVDSRKRKGSSPRKIELFKKSDDRSKSPKKTHSSTEESHSHGEEPSQSPTGTQRKESLTDKFMKKLTHSKEKDDVSKEDSSKEKDNK